jgi:Uma2 family endonuclease
VERGIELQFLLDDSYSDTQERAQDYREMVLKTVWIVDPKTRTGRICSGTEWVESHVRKTRGTPFFVNLPEVFGQSTPA